MYPLQRKMKNFLVSFYLLLISIILVALTPIPSAQQLTTYECRILLQVQKLLEHPEALQGWTYLTNLCFIPPSPSLNIVCTNGHVTELTIVGNKIPLLSPSHQRTKPVSWNSDETLSERFSIDSFFTVLSRLSHLKVLSLVSIGLWGPLPSKISRFWSLEVLNISSNFIYGEIPSSVSKLRNLRSLVLANNLFNGSVPDLTRLAFLQELDLGGNNLGPEFPSMSKNLVRIVLRNNSLICQIPPQLMQVHKLEQFDVSSNGIFGNIPPFLFSLPFLQYLNLASNQFSGSLSQNITCGSVLTFVDISHNLLEGKLPSCIISSRFSNRTMLYSWNCLSTRRSSDQYPPPYCKNMDALAVKPPVRSHKEESEMHTGMVLGIFGVVVVVALLILFVFRKYKAERAENNMDKSFADKFSALAYPRSNIGARHTSHQTVNLAALGLPRYCTFTSEEIEDATSNFDSSNLLGEGPQGQLYKGRLIDGSVVLVNHVKLSQKSLHKNNMQNLKKVLPNLRHRNLVSVLGHSVITYQDHPQTASTIFIVFEHISKVTLKDHLADKRRKEMLKWPLRMAISIGIARGIQFLHTGVAPGIFGNNLKIENILLDDSLNAKVSGYSIPLPSKKGPERKYNEQRGPNHIESTNDAEKEDIYQLGLILLQVITGKLITSSSEVEELKNELERSLSEAASSTPRLTIDPSLRGSYVYESLRTALQITINCLSKVASNRPSIEDVLWNLQYSMQVQEARSSSANSPRL